MIWGYGLAGAVIVNLVISLPFSAFVLFTNIEAKFSTLRKNLCAGYTVRLSTVALLTFMGIVVPLFMEMINIVSAVLVVSIVILLPTAFVMKLDYDEGGIKAIHIEHVLTFILGLRNLYFT